MTFEAPAVSVLDALDDDTWSRLVGHVRRVLRRFPDDPTAGELLSLGVPPLLTGDGRTRLAVELATGGDLWDAVAERLVADDEPGWREALYPTTPHAPAASAPGPSPTPRTDGSRERVRELTRQRDQARRQAEGADARARAAEQRVEVLEGQLADAAARIAELEAVVASADDERAAALDKLQRRVDTESVALREEVRALRRAEDERRPEERRREEAAAAAARAEEQAEHAARRERTTGTQGAVAGRPSRLPAGVQPGTSAAARSLLTARHRVLVDGYNLTLRHRGHLDLEHQRGWLIALLEAVATRFRCDVVVFFDSRGGAPPASQRSRAITVRFTAPGVTADDEIVFDVEVAAEDQPILVVTDDRELRDRVRPFRVDVLATGEFVRAVE